MEFDSVYYNRLSDFFNNKDGVIYEIAEMTDEPERFVFHVKHYIDNTVGDMVHVEFNAGYTKIKVLEFFESRTPKPVAPQPVKEHVKKSTKGLFS